MPKLKYLELSSERLNLRLPIKSDVRAQYKYLSNPNNYPFTDYKVAKSKKDVHDYFERMFKEHLYQSLFWMIVKKDRKKPIGTISAWNINWEEMTIEFGYSLYPEYRGFGYMAEALQCVIDFLKKENNFYLFDIWTDNQNVASRNLAESLGFTYLNDEVEKAHNSDKFITYACYRLDLREDS
ncbi:MAG: GNAT family N-acetyltransferase [Tenericutes bacterium]|nr:GNAT family N-acetyltransferase [Mycoplasmatota bacterium]